MTAATPLWKKILKYTALLVIVLCGAALALAWYSGAWHLVFPSTEHNTQPPWIINEMLSPAVLVFSKTNGFRHEAGIRGGKRALEDIVLDNGWGYFATENGAIFSAKDLERFDTVVFLNATGDMLSEAQQKALQDWLENGGGWLGIHAAGDGSHAGWRWYMENLIGVNFTAHIMGPQLQRATVFRESQAHPVVRRMPNVWSTTEEWYSWDSSPRTKGFEILAVVDEDSYEPLQRVLGYERDLGMGDHPVVWSNCVGEGRSVYSALGHTAEAFDRSEYRILLEDALRWTLGIARAGC